MMIAQQKQAYLEAILDTNHDRALQIIDDCLAQGHPPETLIFEIVIPTIEELSEIVRLGSDATLAQLYVASQISSEASDRLVPLFDNVSEPVGKVVIGTAYEDFHGLGKKIVSGCLKAKFVNIIDVGLNVSPEKFVNEAIKHNADVIAVSSMMLHTAKGDNGPIKIRELLQKKKLENQITLVVGGAPYRFHPELYKTVGADAWADNGISAAQLIVQLINKG